MSNKLICVILCISSLYFIEIKADPFNVNAAKAEIIKVLDYFRMSLGENLPNYETLKNGVNDSQDFNALMKAGNAISTADNIGKMKALAQSKGEEIKSLIDAYKTNFRALMNKDESLKPRGIPMNPMLALLRQECTKFFPDPPQPTSSSS